MVNHHNSVSSRYKTGLILSGNACNISSFGDSMIIAVDEALPYWKELLADLGSIRPYSARNIKPQDIRDVDALVVRSVTPINASLLEGSSVQFVAAASAGYDHVDQNYLKSRGVHFAYSAGCNADAVSEYITIALHIIASRKGWKLSDKSLAVVGVGNVGSRVATKARALGMKVLLCDPPLRDATGDPQYRPLDEVLAADILTFHVPLVAGQPYPTRHMVDRKLLSRLSPKQFLFNTSRGAVFDNQDLKAALCEGRIEGAVLDVWEGEPRLDFPLLEMIDIGTPHIAGTALDGKIRATEMARTAICAFFKIDQAKSFESLYPASRPISPEPQAGVQDGVLSVLLQVSDLLKADAGLRALAATPEQAAAGFEQLRTQHPLRPEFRHFIVDLDQRHIDLSETFAKLGFRLKGTGSAGAN
jgi:erythronate-4-phosphate dehydrogenase